MTAENNPDKSFETAIPVWRGEDDWLYMERHSLHAMGGLHWHSHIEVNYLPGGSVRYLTRGQSVRLDAGQIAVFWAAIPHQVVSVEDSGEMICVYIPLQEFLRWRLPIRFGHSLVHGNFALASTPGATDGTLLEQWWQDWLSEDIDRYRLALDEIQLRLRRLALTGWYLGHLDPASDQLNQPNSRMTASAGIVHVEAMIRFIAEHYSEPIRIETMADHVGLHPNYAMTLFKQVIGSPISAYITRHRLSHAQAMLLNSDEKVLTIVMECGFGSLSRFYDVFRKNVGVTPRQYRQRWRHV